MFKCLYPGQKSLLAISFPFTVKVCSLNYSLKNFQGFSSTVQLSRFALLVLSRTSLNILAHQLSNVKHFFTFFRYLSALFKRAEKEGFEPSRRC